MNTASDKYGRKGILASIENVSVSRIRPRELEEYPWYIPEEPLSERKSQAEGRREELLQLLYQDSISPDQIEELVREWITLVMERDKLLHEELNKENTEEKVMYIRQLKRVLRQMPSLSASNDEMSLREALLNLERHVSAYCQSHDIGSPSSTLQRFHSVPLGVEHHGMGVDSNSYNFSDSFISSSSMEQDAPAPTTMKSVPTEPDLRTVSGAPKVPNSTHPVPPRGPSSIPPPPPPPPPIIPGAGGNGSGGVTGTAQFSGMKHRDETTGENNVPDEIDGEGKPGKMLYDLEHDVPSAQEGTLRKDLMEEIVSVGQRSLRHTNRARSPGGTPVKMQRRLTQSSNNDMLQKALINKFRSLHSTPIRQPSSTSVTSEGGPFDFSNTWSDINNSDFDDPDISSGDATPGLLHASDPNASKRSTTV